MKHDQVDYEDQGTALEGFVVYPALEKRPAVLLCHAWSGRDEYICEKAKLMAEWGYVGFALDLYGKGVTGTNREENTALKRPFVQDRALLQRRLLKSLDVLSALPNVDKTRIAALGFGFGGLAALDLARTGRDLKGAISVYGHFEPSNLPAKPVRTKILILHGYDDPIVPPQDLASFAREMKNVDWQAHLFSGTMHAFTNPKANDPAYGTVYNPYATERALSLSKSFLAEVFS